MNESIKNTLVAAVAALVVMAGLVTSSVLTRQQVVVMSADGSSAPAVESALGGKIHNIQESFDAGLAVNGTEVISSSGAVATDGITLGSGTELKGHLFTTAKRDVVSLVSLAATSSAVSLTGAAVGDVVSVGLTGPWGGTSSSAAVSASVTATNVVTLYWKNTSTTSVDLTESTYNVSVWQH